MNLNMIKAERSKSSLDWLKWLLAVLITILLGIMNYYFSDKFPALQVVVSLIAFITVVGLISFTDKGKKFWRFTKESRIELRKVVWATRKETIQSTITVMVVVIVMALFLWGIDSILLWGIKFFTGQIK
jgi:preprotein translocase subunit SecE